MGWNQFSKEDTATFGNVVLTGLIINLLTLPVAGHEISLLEKVEMV